MRIQDSRKDISDGELYNNSFKVIHRRCLRSPGYVSVYHQASIIGGCVDADKEHCTDFT